MNRSEWIYGIHTVASTLDARPEAVLEVWIARDRKDARATDLFARARLHEIAVKEVSGEALSRRVASDLHQGVAARTRPVPVGDDNTLKKLDPSANPAPFLLALDGVTDPHNFGACLRTSEAAGVCVVIVPRARTAPVTPAVRKVAVGAAERVRIAAVSNLARSLDLLKQAGFWIYGLDQHADTSLFQLDVSGPVVFVLGSEGKGLRRMTRDRCDYLVKLPMVGRVESLNVSVSAGICLYEAVRQRG